MGTNSTKGTPTRVSEDSYFNFYEGNFGATRQGGVPVEATSASWNLSEGRARSKAYFATSYSQGGANAQVGQLIKIDGSVSKDLEITFDCDYGGYGEVLGTGSADLVFQALVVDDDGPLFPEVGDSSILKRSEFVDRHFGVYQNGKESGSPSSTLIVPSYELNDGQVLRLVVACSTIAQASSAGSSQSDAYDSGSTLDYRITFGLISVGWR